jgi:ribosomal protein L24E
MHAHRDGRLIVLCDTCYRLPPGETVIRQMDGFNSVLHFCNEQCAREYRAPRRVERHTS